MPWRLNSVSERAARGTALATFVVLLTGAALTATAAMPVAQPPQGTPTPRPTLVPGECRPDGSVSAPERAYVGETIGITLTARVLCAGEVFPLHTVFVLDESGPKVHPSDQVMREAARAAARCLGLEEYPEVRAAVVGFDQQARVLCDLTDSEERVLECIRRAGAVGGKAIDLGIQEGLKVIIAGRSDHGGGGYTPETHEVMVLFSDGLNDAGCQAVLQAANKAKTQGILVITVCVGPRCDSSCMRQVATSPRYAYEVQMVGQLCKVFEAIRREITDCRFNSLTVKMVSSDNMRYVDDSAEPEAEFASPSGDVLLWQTNYVPGEGVTYTFEVDPLVPGYWPAATEIFLVGEDARRRKHSLLIPAPHVRVEVPPTPTPKATPKPGTRAYLPFLTTPER